MIKFVNIQNPYEVGQYSVEKNAKTLQRYRFLHEELIRIQAGQLPAREDWDLKLALCKHLYEDAEAVSLLRKRIPQLRTSSAVLKKNPDPCLSLLMEELIHARSDLELTEGIYGVIKPAMLDTYRRHASKTQQVVDQPTIRLLKTMINDLEEQIQWGNEMLDELVQSGIHPPAKEFTDNLREILKASGGIDGSGNKSSDLPNRMRSHEPYQLPLKSIRDPRKMGPTTLARTSIAPAPKDEVQIELANKMRVRQEEMTACELVAGVLYSQYNMPWDFYSDLARHIWDEARHAMFGQAALEEEGHEWMNRPQYTADYDLNAPKIPAVKYAWLSLGIEEGAMISNRKKQEFEFCRDQAKHSLMTMFQDYDWADEVVHANLGRRWTPSLFEEEIGFVRDVAGKELDTFLQIHHQANHEWKEKENSKEMDAKKTN